MNEKILDLDNFKEWLTSNTKLTEYSVRDVVSRLKRISLHLDVMAPSSYKELSTKFNEISESYGYNYSIKSQLKRAAKLYRQFKFQK